LYIKGDGGNAGIQRLFVNTVKGNVRLRTCRGNGAAAATNGLGGNGTLNPRDTLTSNQVFFF